ncbi:unnamed protein product [Paramecium pentaurelia]|uniref:Uncharacterized protein n=1 Tax=Paramecium pentaurelia TaxID=43138 RepID=A0A8S1YI21_9CILI|nr:unnamed protein product [Paramecium pentaurelia]
MYYNALAWRLYNYLFVMQQISTNLFQINKNAIIESKSEQILNVFQKMLNIGSQNFGGLPTVGNAFNTIMLLSILDLNIIKSINLLQDQENQIQIASLELNRNQQANLINEPKSRFRKFADQLLQDEDKQFRDIIYWAAGTEDALIILNYLEAIVI